MSEQAEEPTVIDAELADQRAVDPPPEARRERVFRTLMWATEDKRRPIVPAWLRSREDAAAGARFVARHGAHVAGYHLTRSPKYAARLVTRAPVGGLRAGMNALAWWWDREGAPLRRGAVDRGDLEGYMRLTKERNARVRTRGAVVAALSVALIALCVAVCVLAPWWGQLVTLGMAVAALGVLGTPPDRRVVDRVVSTTGAPVRLTADIVTRALSSLGITGITQAAKSGPAVTYPSPITRDGPGWRADVDLPHGVTAADVMERRERLASGLRRPLSAVWPEPAGEHHAGRLVLWVGDLPLNKVKPATWPLLRSGAVQVIGGRFPFGTDQRQRAVPIALEETNALIGALPGGGKTAAVRVLALAAALDPHAELRIGEHKGSGDLEALELVATRYASGVDDEALAETLASLRDLLGEVGRRASALKRLPRSAVPDRKVTPELAARPGSGLHPIVQVIDEAQELFTHPEYGGEAGDLAEKIIKRGRAFGVVLIIATQRPDAKSVPTGVAGNVGLRFCLRVTGQVENDMVLGTSAYKNGVRATTFSPSDRGIGFLVGAGDDPVVCRTYYLDAEAAQRVAERARAAREAAGTLAGHAVGERVEQAEDANLLDDLATVFVESERLDKVWSEVACERLAELRPGVYGGWKPAQLAAALKPLGITTAQVWGEDEDGQGRNRRGIALEDVIAAIESRDGARLALDDAGWGPSETAIPSARPARSSTAASGPTAR